MILTLSVFGGKEKMEIKIQSDFSIANLDQMMEVYHNVGWTKHTNEIIQQVFKASNVIALATVNGRIIGFGRALSDGVLMLQFMMW